jgi:hypothetical protein
MSSIQTLSSNVTGVAEKSCPAWFRLHVLEPVLRRLEAVTRLPLGAMLPLQPWATVAADSRRSRPLVVQTAPAALVISTPARPAAIRWSTWPLMLYSVSRLFRPRCLTDLIEGHATVVGIEARSRSQRLALARSRSAAGTSSRTQPPAAGSSPIGSRVGCAIPSSP